MGLGWTGLVSCFCEVFLCGGGEGFLQFAEFPTGQAEKLALGFGHQVEELCSLDYALPQNILRVFWPAGEYSLQGLKGLVLCDLDCHIIVILVCVFIDFVINNNLVLFVPEVEEDAVLVATFGLAREVLAVLNSAEEDLHALVDLIEGLRAGGGTMKAVAAACVLRKVT